MGQTTLMKLASRSDHQDIETWEDRRVVKSCREFGSKDEKVKGKNGSPGML